MKNLNARDFVLIYLNLADITFHPYSRFSSWLSLWGPPLTAPLLAFTVDPQEEAERKESRLAVIADHLGFSWTGKQSLKASQFSGAISMVAFNNIFFVIFIFYRIGTRVGI